MVGGCQPLDWQSVLSKELFRRSDEAGSDSNERLEGELADNIQIWTSGKPCSFKDQILNIHDHKQNLPKVILASEFRY